MGSDMEGIWAVSLKIFSDAGSGEGADTGQISMQFEYSFVLASTLIEDGAAYTGPSYTNRLDGLIDRSGVDFESGAVRILHFWKVGRVIERDKRGIKFDRCCVVLSNMEIGEIGCVTGVDLSEP